MSGGGATHACSQLFRWRHWSLTASLIGSNQRAGEARNAAALYLLAPQVPVHIYIYIHRKRRQEYKDFSLHSIEGFSTGSLWRSRFSKAAGSWQALEYSLVRFGFSQSARLSFRGLDWVFTDGWSRSLPYQCPYYLVLRCAHCRVYLVDGLYVRRLGYLCNGFGLCFGE